MERYWVIDNRKQSVGALTITGKNVLWMIAPKGLGQKKTQKLMSFCSEVRNAVASGRSIETEEPQHFWLTPQ